MRLAAARRSGNKARKRRSSRAMRTAMQPLAQMRDHFGIGAGEKIVQRGGQRGADIQSDLLHQLAIRMHEPTVTARRHHRCGRLATG